MKVKDEWTPALAALQSLPTLVERPLMITGENMAGMGREHVPVDTGFLQSTIGYQVTLLQLIFFALAGYAGFVEFGTYRMGPQPFMRPAWDAYLQELAGLIIAEFEMKAGK